METAFERSGFRFKVIMTPDYLNNKPVDLLIGPDLFLDPLLASAG